MSSQSNHYSRLTITLHWLMLLLFVGVYSCIELRELYPKGSDPREALKAWHFMLGLTVLIFAFVRIYGRVTSATPPITPPLKAWQSLVSKLVHLALYVLMVGLPLLGWATLSAAGKPIPFFGLELPALLAENKDLAKTLKELHKTIGEAGYYLIGLHAAAALFHHYVQKDNTLTRMLPNRK